MVAKRTARIYRLHQSLGLVLPIDWARGMGIGKGDLVEVTYNGTLNVRPLKDRDASNAGVVAPDVPARRPARPVETDEGGLVDVNP